MARKSFSVSGPGGVEEKDAGALAGVSPLGTFCRGSSSTPGGKVVIGISSDSISISGDDSAAGAPFPLARSCGITRKNSLASLSSVSGAGIGNDANGNRFS
jgi:hypothetical protein